MRCSSVSVLKGLCTTAQTSPGMIRGCQPRLETNHLLMFMKSKVNFNIIPKWLSRQGNNLFIETTTKYQAIRKFKWANFIKFTCKQLVL